MILIDNDQLRTIKNCHRSQTSSSASICRDVIEFSNKQYASFLFLFIDFPTGITHRKRAPAKYKVEPSIEGHLAFFVIHCTTIVSSNLILSVSSFILFFPSIKELSFLYSILLSQIERWNNRLGTLLHYCNLLKYIIEHFNARALSPQFHALKIKIWVIQFFKSIKIEIIEKIKSRWMKKKNKTRR